MKLALAIVIGALVIAGSIAGSILFIGRYQIAAMGYGFSGDGERQGDTLEEKVFRLDRWTGEIEDCAIGGADPQAYIDRVNKTGRAVFTCAFPKESAQPASPGPPPSE